MFGNIRGLVYTLFGTLVLTTLWVSSLSVLSTRANATTLLADAGAQVLNPYLVRVGYGVSPATYQTLEGAARAHPEQPLALPSLLTVTVRGGEIVGKSYADGVLAIYQRVAEVYYDKGASGVFAIPPELQSVLTNFGVFSQSGLPAVPGVPQLPSLPSPTQLPNFVQPFFTFVGLTPNTFTTGGHAQLLGLLPWFWLATMVLGVLAVVLNRSETKLEGLAHGLIHGTWPVVVVLIGATILAGVQAQRFGAYRGVLGVVDGAFLPIYGAGLALGLVGLALTVALPALRKRGQGSGGAPAAVGVAGSAWPRPDMAMRAPDAGLRGPDAGPKPPGAGPAGGAGPTGPAGGAGPTGGMEPGDAPPR